MGKDKSVGTSKKSVEKNIELKRAKAMRRKVFIVVFLLVLFSSIFLRIYCADQSGISYDEAVTFDKFGRNIHTALHSYPYPNNHVLNSIFIYYAHKYFGNYEHFIRLPSLLAGIVFSFAVSYIVCKTIRSKVLCIVLLAMILFVPAVFRYSFMARGYVFALGAIFTEIALVLWLLEHKIKWHYWLVLAMVISLMNFLAFGAMLSSILLLASFNLTFVLFYSSKVFRDAPNRLVPFLLNGVCIGMATCIPVFFLYRGIYKQILEINSSWKGWADFVSYLRLLLVKWMLGPKGSFGWGIFYAIIVLVVVALAFHLYRFRMAIKGGMWREYLKIGESEGFVFIVTGLMMVFMFIYGVIMNRDIGFPRNQIFLIPLVLISGGIILDRFIVGLGENTLGRVIYAVVLIVIASATLRRLPLPDRVGGLFSGPVLRKLKAIDPDKTWSIGFSKRMKLEKEAFGYYRQFDYKFRIVQRDRHDVMIYRREERPRGAVCLDWEYFAKCAVVLNCPLPTDRVILEARLIKD